MKIQNSGFIVTTWSAGLEQYVVNSSVRFSSVKRFFYLLAAEAVNWWLCGVGVIKAPPKRYWRRLHLKYLGQQRNWQTKAHHPEPKLIQNRSDSIPSTFSRSTKRMFVINCLQLTGLRRTKTVRFGHLILSNSFNGFYYHRRFCTFRIGNLKYMINTSPNISTKM